MNQKVYHTLEYYKILDMLAGYASCEETRKRALALTPITDAAEIEHLQQTTSDALSRLYKGSGISFAGIHNVNASLKRLDIGGSLNTTELLHICSLLEVAKRAKAYDRSDRADDKTDSLSPLFSQIEPLSPLLEEIKRCVIGEDEIADDASPALFKIRKSIRGMNDRIHAQLTNLMNNTTTRSYLQDAVITMRDGRYCLPVKAEAKTSVPGMVHDQSSSGSTLFIEPMAVVNLNNELRELFLKEQDEINVILADLSNRVAENANGIRQDYSVLAELDFIFAKAQLAKSYNGVAPIFNEEGRIHIRKGRHPLLDAKKVVPIDVRLGEDFRQLIVTGPNTGGKTVSLKTVGLLTLMGQSGLHIPALDGSRLNVFDDVFADIGDEQSIEQNLSTFSSHMSNIVYILDHVTPGSLVLFDELGGGTDPIEGAALAIAILSHLNDMGVRCMATTHYSELKTFAMSTPGVENASCEFDVATLQPTYKLMIGIPGKSNAFAIAKKLGIDDSIIESAKANIDSDTVDFETLIADLERSKREIEQDKADIARLKEDAKQLQERAQMKDSELSDKKSEILAKARQEASEIIEEAKAEADAAIRKYNKWTTNPSKADAKAMEAERQKLRAKINDLGRMNEEKRKTVKSDHKASDFKVGDTVHVISMDSEGTIMALADSKGKLKVQMGIISAALPPTDLLLVEHEKKKPQKATVTGGKSMNRMMNIKPEINVLGMTVDEATSLVDRFLDDALMAHLHRVTIIHGKGTGALRKGIHQFLKSQPHVKSFRLGEFGEGDAGVTIVEL